MQGRNNVTETSKIAKRRVKRNEGAMKPSKQICRSPNQGDLLSTGESKGKGNYPGIHDIYACFSDRPFPPGNLALMHDILIQPWICAPDTHYSWVGQGSVECKFAWHFHTSTWPAVVIDPRPSDLWSSKVQQKSNSIHLATCSLAPKLKTPAATCWRKNTLQKIQEQETGSYRHSWQ